MQASRHVLIWAGIGILILAGMIIFVLMTNQPQSPAGVAISTPVPAGANGIETPEPASEDAEATQEIEPTSTDSP